MFKRKPISKIKILFVDENNDLQSQIAEYFAKEMYNDVYDVYSAGTKVDCINCELISVMYQLGYDIRDYKSKDFDEKELPKSFDYIIFLEKETYDRVKDVMPWKAKQILFDFGRKNNFEEATDDLELYECFKTLIEKVKDWVGDNLNDFEKLNSMVI